MTRSVTRDRLNVNLIRLYVEGLEERIPEEGDPSRMIGSPQAFPKSGFTVGHASATPDMNKTHEHKEDKYENNTENDIKINQHNA